MSTSQRFACSVLLTVVLSLAAWAQAQPLDMRDVTMSANDASGKAVPGAEMMATYCVNDEISYRVAKADAAGKVSWTGLPRTRIIVWGRDLATQVIEPDDRVTPLPSPESNNNGRGFGQFWSNINITIPLNGVTSGAVMLVTSRNNRNNGFMNNGFANNGYTTEYINLQNAKDYTVNEQIMPGGRFSLLAVLPGTPRQFALLNDVYMPLMDMENRRRMVNLTLTTTPLTILECHFRHHGTVVSHVSRLEVQPAGTALTSAAELLARLLKPQPLPEGYRVLLPGAGRYRLLVDLFSETTSVLPGSLIDVPQAGNTVQIELPDPLFSAPTGTEVNWATRNAPRQVLSLHVAHGATGTPVYGPKDDLLAAWYHPSPDVLQILHGGDGLLTRHTLQSATIDLQADGERTGGFASLLPLLPSIAPELASLNANRLDYGHNDYPLIWSGSYLVSGASCYTQLDIADGKPNACNVSLSRPQDNGPKMGNRNMRVDIPRYLPAVKHFIVPSNGQRNDYSQEESTCMMFADGNSQPFTTVMLRNNGMGITLPAGAKTLTCYCPGLGVIPNIPVPPADEANPTITLDGWQPGVDLTGKLLDKDGKPLAHADLVLQPLVGGSLQEGTDGTGGFHFANLLPGPVLLTSEDQERGSSTSWYVDVTKDGQGITLSLQGGVTIYSDVQGGYRRFNNGQNKQTWWLPAGGKPMPIKLTGSYNGSPYGASSLVCGLTLGKGVFWSDETMRSGNSLLHEALLFPGATVNLNDEGNLTAASFLGLYLPLELTHTVQPSIDVEGQDALAGFHVHYDEQWEYAPELSLLYRQLGPLPQGNYRVTLSAQGHSCSRQVTMTEHGANAKFTYPE